MKEDFLHYIWQHKKFDFSNLKTINGEDLLIINSGFYTQLAGPDFFNGQIVIGTQKWSGNIEIHIKSSDWYIHNHEKDSNYDSVILHVVWEHDAPIFRKDNTEIPVLELKSYVDFLEYKKYKTLLTPKSWIYCEKQIATVDDFILKNWQERLFFERLERKSISINSLLQDSENDWESVLFCLLAKNFGLNNNGETFLKIAKSITFSVIRKESLEVLYLEALLFGQANLLPQNPEDTYSKELISWFEYLSLKYKIDKIESVAVQFFKHRPDNFPTIRLAQLCMVYHVHRNLFSKICKATSQQEIYEIFDVSVSNYWLTHYTFDKESPKKRKPLSKSFIDLLIINTIIPLQFAFFKSQGKDNSEQLIQLVSSLASEKNTIIDRFKSFGIQSQNAFDSQALLQLKNEFCDAKKCLSCAVGLELIKN